MSLYLSPMFYGIQDHVVPDSTPFAVRVYYPTDDDTVLGPPLLKGPHPLVVFAHGKRDNSTLPVMCPPEYSRDHQRWGVVLGGIARSGYVVASLNVQDILPSASGVAGRISATIGWMRSKWEGRNTILAPPAADPGTHSGGLSEDPDAEILQSKVGAPYAAAAPFHLPPVVLGWPTALALIGHSWGTRGVCAFAAANSGVAALVTIAGTFEHDESNNLRQARVPTLIMCGTADSQNFAPMQTLWLSLSTPKYQTAFQGVGHWDWFGRFGAIRRCDGTPPPWRDTGHIAGELIAGFFARHVARVGYPPPDLVRIPILRPNGIPWYEHESAIQMRWDAPGQNFDTLPTTGDGILGPWTASPPW